MGPQTQGPGPLPWGSARGPQPAASVQLADSSSGGAGSSLCNPGPQPTCTTGLNHHLSPATGRPMANAWGRPGAVGRREWGCAAQRTKPFICRAVCIKKLTFHFVPHKKSK